MSGMLIDPVPGKTSGTSSPLTTKGDVFGFAAANARVPVGGNTEYLGGDSTNANGVSYSNPLDALRVKQFAQHFAANVLPSCTYSNGASGVGATLTGTANNALSINSNLVAAGDYVVVNAQASTFQNGLYVVVQTGLFGVSPFILMRSAQMNKPAQFFGSCIFYPGVNLGSGTSGNIVICTSAVTTIGTDAVSFSVMRLTVPNADLVVGATNTVKGNVGAGTADLSPAQLNTMTGNSGDVSIAAFGSTPTANGASLTGQAIALQPADGTHPGAIALAAQTMGSGDKTFSGKVIPQSSIQWLTSISFPAVLSVNGQAFDYCSSTNGRVIYGCGSGFDVLVANRAGSTAMGVVANSTTVQFGGDIDVSTAGKGLRVAEGSNAKQGTATLVAGTVTVANTSVTANSRIFLSGGALNASTAIGELDASTITAGTSFVIRSLTAGAVTTQAGDLRTVFYEIFEPG
jgi:hypothetical protein